MKTVKIKVVNANMPDKRIKQLSSQYAYVTLQQECIEGGLWDYPTMNFMLAPVENQDQFVQHLALFKASGEWYSRLCMSVGQRAADSIEVRKAIKPVEEMILEFEI